MILIYSFLVLIFLIVLYITIKFINKPIRKLKSAQKRKTFYLLDDPTDVRKNFLLTYKGLLFEGEKYPNETSEVTSIFIWLHDHNMADTLNTDDVHAIEKILYRHYPLTTIDWKSTESSI